MRSLCLVFGLVFGLGIAPSYAQNSDPVELGDPWAGVEEMIVSGGGAQILTKVDTAAAIGFDAEILQAEDGNEALAMWQSHEPHIVVLDMMLPERSGFLVLEELREASSPPIVVRYA